MATSNYWTPVSERRITRRRLVIASAGFAAGSAFLAACGGGDDHKNSGSFTLTEDSTKQAKRGGTLPVSTNLDLKQMDPNILLIGSLSTAFVFSRLFRLKPGLLKPSSGEVIGDMIKSWEISPDKLQLTMKLRDKYTWHKLPPVNGRKVVAEDIVASWDRYAKRGQTASFYANSANPNSPVLRMKSVDDSTIVMDLAQPSAGITRLFSTGGGGTTGGGGVYFIPREGAAGDYDPGTTGIGAGPLYLDHYEPSARIELKRHDGYYETVTNFIDGVTQFIIPEYASGLSQFSAGKLLQFDVLPEDVLATKSRVPQLELRAADPVPQWSNYMFGFNPAKGTPFIDKRVRQALALSVDRELYFDSFWNRKKYAEQGIPIQVYNSTCLDPLLAGNYWLDPLGHDFGPNAKYYKLDLEEAKKLMAAAGYRNGLDNEIVYTPEFGKAHVQQIQIFVGFASAVGVQLKEKPLSNNNSDFRPKYIFSHGDYNGIAVTYGFATTILDPIERLISEYVPSEGVAFPGFMADGMQWKSGDPAYTDLLKAARTEFDEKRRIEMAAKIQRLEGENQYKPMFPGTAQSLSLTWPALLNVNVFHQDLPYLNLWIDKTKAPLA